MKEEYKLSIFMMIIGVFLFLSSTYFLLNDIALVQGNPVAGIDPPYIADLRPMGIMMGCISFFMGVILMLPIKETELKVN